MGKSTIVNGRRYDAKTGLPLSDNDGSHVSHISRNTLRAHKRATAAPKPAVQESSRAGSVHQRTQKSSTLNRKFTKKPSHTDTAHGHTIVKKQAVRHIDGMKSRSTAGLTRKNSVAPIHRSQQKAAAVTTTHTKEDAVSPATRHPLVKRVHQTQAERKQSLSSPKTASHDQPASVIKQAVINESLNNAPKHHAKQHKSGASKRLKMLSVICGCAALMLFGGYLTYLNAPNLSVRVAGTQAGIDASYPSYHPDGYSLNGPVAFSDGEVSMKFVANSGTDSYTLKQAESSWDSKALLQNYVKDASNDNYSVSQEKGITVYNYENHAAWVSGGILYTIKGDATLSPSQIRKIATSV